jgi:nucleoside-diphosphate-sugar epimerase
MRRALVTGATGMLGSYIERQLLASGVDARALVRRPGDAAWLRELGAELMQGELADAPSLRAAAAGCDAVFHAAAAIGPEPTWETFRVGNVEGTAHVVDACAHANARLVHVSSTAVYGDSRYQFAPVDERMVLPTLLEGDAYGRSKQEAERIVLEAHAAHRIWGAIVRPPIMYGEHDRQFAPRIAVALDRGLFPLCAGGRTTLPMVHANAVAEGAVRAANVDVAGGRAYNLTTDFPLTVAELVRYAAIGLDRRIRAPSLSLGVSRALFRILALGLTAAGRRDLGGHAMGSFEMLVHDNPFSSERARSELQWSPTIRPEIGVPGAFRWWKAHHGSA